MTVTPKIHLVAFEDRAGAFIFVAIPNQRGRYVRTDKSVAVTHCPHCPHCLAAIGEPCKGRNGDGYGGTTHAIRRTMARKHWGQQSDDVVQIELAPDGSEVLT